MIKRIFRRFPIHFLVIFVGSLFSQPKNVTGVIIDRETKIPIHGASIFSKELGYGTSSKVDGSFILEDLLGSELSFEVSMMGYKKVNRLVVLEKTNNEIGKVFLNADTLKFEKLIVDAHSKIKPKSFSSNIDVVGDKYHKVLKSTLALTIQEETGLSVRSMGQATAQPVLRGYKGHRFLLTDNGISTGDLSNTSVDHAVSTDMGAYSGIKIIRGPEALLYGSNTIGGVIDLLRDIDDKNRYKRLTVKTLVGTETVNKGHFQNISLKLPFSSNHQMRISLLNRELGNQTSPIGTLNNTQSVNREVHGNYMYFGKDSHSSFSLERFDMDYGIPGSPEGHINGVSISMHRNTQKFGFHKDISIGGFQTLDIDQRYIDYRHSESVTGSSYASVILAHQIFSLDTKLSGKHRTIGSLFKIRDFQAYEFYWTPDSREISISVYGLYEKEINNYTLQSSFRLENNFINPDLSSEYFFANLDVNQIDKRNFTLFSVSAAAILDKENWELSLGSMLTSRAPSIEDLYSDGPHLGVYNYEIGFPELGAEHTYGLEGSLSYVNKRIDLKITSYQNYSPNYHLSKKLGSGYVPGADWIEWGSGSAGWLYMYQMSGLEVYIHGYESDIHYKINEILNVGGSFSATRGENLTENSPLYYMPPDKIILSTELNLEPVSINFAYNKVFDQNRTGLYEDPTEGYKTFNLNAAYTISSSNFIHKIIFQVDNIFNEEYYNHLSRIKSIMPEKGRNVGIQYRLVF